MIPCPAVHYWTDLPAEAVVDFALEAEPDFVSAAVVLAVEFDAAVAAAVVLQVEFDAAVAAAVALQVEPVAAALPVVAS